MTTRLTTTQGSHARTASPAFGLPSPCVDEAGTGTSSSPTADVAVSPAATGAKVARYSSTSLGRQTCTKRITQMSETSAASTSGSSGPTKLETANWVTANETPAT